MISNKVQNWIRKNTEKLSNPTYIYDKDLIDESCKRFDSISYPHTKIHFATMANCNSEFVSRIKKNNFNVFVNSQNHLDTVKEIGYKAQEIIFTASSIDSKMIQSVYQENLFINLDSLSQLKHWFENYPDRPVGIRCNIENDTFNPKSSRAGTFIGEDSRLGLNIEEIKSIEKKEQINGLHIYVGTDIIDIEYFISFYKTLLELAQNFPNIEYIDFGGGFGFDENGQDTFDFEKYSKIVSKIMTNFSKQRNKPIKLILEPGRIIGGPTAYFICKVTDIKQRNNIQIVGVNASSAQFPRPLLYPEESFHPIKLLDNNGITKQGEFIDSKVSGCSTYSKDYLSHKTIIPNAEIGDYIVFENAGAYCASMHTSFLGFSKPEELFL